jgi:hypothetical protein
VSVASVQRFKKSQRCPICGGADGDKRGAGKRCHGYLSEDGAYAHCSREEHAGGLPVEKGGTYAHRMAGPCKCGTTHGADERAWDGIEAAYDYRDERGILLFQVVRLIPKSFRQRKPNGDGTWDWRTSDVRRVLYRLPELLTAPRSEPVYIAEGEKDVDRLRSLGVLATCNPMGAGKWSFVAELARSTLRNRRVLVLADADKPGRDHAAEVVASLTESAAAVADLFPGEDSGKDVSDWLDAGNAIASLKLPDLPASMVTHTESFLPMPARLDGERDERIKNDERALKYHHAFLDDALRALLPNDLVLLGAPTGLGKTDLAMNIAATNAMLGRRVHYFALEAEPRELERRTKFAMISNLAHGRGDGQSGHPRASDLNYADWLLGRCEDIASHYNEQVDRVIRKMLSTLWTYYRGQIFGAQDLQKQILGIHKDTDLIVIDHLHYIDIESDEHETRAVGDVVKTIRDVSLRVGKPVILIAHLRKRELGSKRLLATLDDFHGSSNIVKICTQAITIERCHVVEPAAWYLAPTFMAVLKDRRAGAPPFVAVTNFDRRKKSYESKYTLGRLGKAGTEWTPLDQQDVPNWAVHHQLPKQGASA